jgi:hypothetical protein
MNDGNIHHVLISYSPGSLSVYFDSLTTPLFTTSVNLDSLLSLDNGTAFVGFTAGTGNGSQNQDILGWRFAVVPEPSAWALAVLSSASLLALRRRKARKRTGRHHAMA